MKLLFKARSALVSPWSPTGMSKCRLETVRSSCGPAHSGNRMCFAVTFSRSRNYTTKTQIRWCDFTQQQPLCGACNHCLYFPMSVCRSPRSLFFSHWQPLLWTFAWNKHSFLSTGSYPHTLGDVQPCIYVCPSGFCLSSVAVHWTRRLEEDWGWGCILSSPCHAEVPVPPPPPVLLMSLD